MADEPTDPPATGEPDKPDPKKPEIPPEVAAALKKANKEAETLRLKLKEIEDRDKSENDRLKEQLTEANDRTAKAEERAMRLQVAIDKGLSSTQAKRLVGGNQEELEADADDLLETFKPADENGRTPAKPTEALKGGGDPENNEPAPDMRKIVADIPRGF